MRSNIVFGVLVCMLAAFGYFMTRTRQPHAMPVHATDAGVTDAGVADDAGVDDGADAGAVLARPIRVVGTGWDVLAPGIVANGGRARGATSAFSDAHVDVTFTIAENEADAEKQLARGGADGAGADIGVMSLPAFVDSYERLRALEPEVFLVVGWSRGQDAIFGAKDASLLKSRADEPKLANRGSNAALALSLFAVDEAGTPLGRVKITPDPKNTTFSSLTRPFEIDASSSKVLLSTADASHLVPIVAVAPRGFIETHGDTLKMWSKVWFASEDSFKKDVPGSTRVLAKDPGAPEPAALLDRLGQMKAATVRDNVKWLGLSGRPAATLATLVPRTFRLWKDSGRATMPMPDTPLVTDSIFAALVRAEPSLVEFADPVKISAGTDRAILKARVLDPKADEAAIVREVAFLAGIFERSTLRVSTKTPSSTSKVIERAYGTYDIAQGRLVADKSPAENTATIEVLSP